MTGLILVEHTDFNSDLSGVTFKLPGRGDGHCPRGRVNEGGHSAKKVTSWQAG